MRWLVAANDIMWLRDCKSRSFLHVKRLTGFE